MRRGAPHPAIVHRRLRRASATGAWWRVFGVLLFVAVASGGAVLPAAMVAHAGPPEGTELCGVAAEREEGR